MASTFRGVNASKDCHPYTNAHIMNLSLRTGESRAAVFPAARRGPLLPHARVPRRPGHGVQGLLAGGAGPQGFAGLVRPAARFLRQRPASNTPRTCARSAFARENPGPRRGVAARRKVAARRTWWPRQPGQTASLVVKVTTPWIIAGLQNDLTNFEDNTDAAVVSGIFWRLDQVRRKSHPGQPRQRASTWTKVWENRWLGAVPFRVDLTRWTEGEYAYRVKFEWMDRKGSGASRAGEAQHEHVGGAFAHGAAARGGGVRTRSGWHPRRCARSIRTAAGTAARASPDSAR